MNENKMMQQIGTMFGIIMTLFYLGVGLYLLLSQNLTYVDKVLRIIVGSTFIFYGAYRGYRTYVKIVEVFFTKDDDDKTY